jgi:hypothetical protein
MKDLVVVYYAAIAVATFTFFGYRSAGAQGADTR